MNRFKLLVVFLVVAMMAGIGYCEVVPEVIPEVVEEKPEPTQQDIIQERIAILRKRCEIMIAQFRRLENAKEKLEKEFNQKTGAIIELEALLKKK